VLKVDRPVPQHEHIGREPGDEGDHLVDADVPQRVLVLERLLEPGIGKPEPVAFQHRAII
jgi:hypothetical protein